ncbi:hypothetical protein [Afipia carboxidovorans]|uniref:hypothetical protein n=1 Tax=Afipia carboxidovorans TaxID=40137 RepID=UPI0018728C74|nr:hypothetical protein [Afipia carboxidovorans]
MTFSSTGKRNNHACQNSFRAMRNKSQVGEIGNSAVMTQPGGSVSHFALQRMRDGTGDIAPSSEETVTVHCADE